MPLELFYTSTYAIFSNIPLYTALYTAVCVCEPDPCHSVPHPYSWYAGTATIPQPDSGSHMNPSVVATEAASDAAGDMGVDSCVAVLPRASSDQAFLLELLWLFPVSVHILYAPATAVPSVQMWPWGEPLPPRSGTRTNVACPSQVAGIKRGKEEVGDTSKRNWMWGMIAWRPRAWWQARVYLGAGGVGKDELESAWARNLALSSGSRRRRSSKLTINLSAVATGFPVSGVQSDGRKRTAVGWWTG
jgi:hypothetical protein